MTLALLHINDQCLRLISENGETSIETGFSHSSKQGLVTGSAAYETAWTKPHLSNNRFWHELNQNPLPKKLKYARHHADMAYAQLCSMLSKVPSPQLLLSVPASLDNGQLSLLLGLIKAVPAEICGVIDNALLAAGPEHKHVAELQLHQAVLTQLDRVDENRKIRSHETIPELGTTAIYREIAMHASEKLISANRYDPLFLPTSQQQLYNAIPKALSQIVTNDEATISLDTPNGLLTVTLSHGDLKKLLDPFLKKLIRRLDKCRSNRLLLGSGSEIVATFMTDLVSADRVDFNMLAQKGFSLVQSGAISPTPLKRIVTLKSTNSGELAAGPAATHLVNEGRAWRLDDPLSLWLRDKGVRIARGERSDSDLTIHADGRRLKILHKTNGVTIVLPKYAACGEWLKIGKFKLQLIEIHDA